MTFRPFAFMLLALGSIGTTFAGNIILTGHDDDLHRSSAALAQAAGMISFARAGAPNPTLPVLVFDQGSQLTTLLTSLSIPFTNINPASGIPGASNFDITKYSAIGVASDTTCGGCDNTTTGSTNLAGAKDPIADFFNAGGGIFTFAAASNGNYFAFLPASASAPGTVTCANCFTQTAAGAAIGVPAVNGDFPHNFFPFPGTGGLDPLFQVAESYTGPSSSGNLTNQPFTVFITGATIGGGGFEGGDTPEPATVALTGAGLLAAVLSRRKFAK